MLYRDIEVTVKILKGNASENHLMHEANVMHEIADHPRVPLLYGVYVKNSRGICFFVGLAPCGTGKTPACNIRCVPNHLTFGTQNGSKYSDR